MQHADDQLPLDAGVPFAGSSGIAVLPAATLKASGTAPTEVMATRPATKRPASDDIDDIFDGFSAAKQLKAQRALEKQRLQEEQEAAAAKAAKQREAQARKSMVRDPVFGEMYDASRPIDPMSARVHRFDSTSGLNVYKAHALGLGHGGNTRLCPFDCSCCF